MRLLFGLLVSLIQQNPSVVNVQAGPLTLEVQLGSRTAHIFHVVDQISSWSEFCHLQYRAYWEKTYGPFTSEEANLLAEHAKIRRRRGWGSLEPIFYTSRDLEAALSDPRLGKEDAQTERRVFAVFSKRVEEMVAAESEPAKRFVKLLEEKRPELTAFAEKAARLFGVKSLRLPVYLLANPDDHFIGGSYSGGQVTLEVPRKSDAFPSFLHEVFHGFIDPHKPALEAAAKGVIGLDGQTLNEGLCYALSPGLFNANGGKFDSLRLQVSNDFKNGKPLSDSYTRYNRFGLALRPLVSEALNDPKATLAAILPRAVDTWRTLVEVSFAVQPPERPRVISFGPAWEELNVKSWNLGWELSANTHVIDQYSQTFSRIPKGSIVFLLYTPDFNPRFRDIPEAYRDLLPKPMAEIDAAMAKGESLELEGKARGMRIILLAAPNMDGLKALIEKTKLLGQAPPIG